LRPIKRNAHILIQNFSYLSILEICNLIFPFFSYSYLIRTIGKDLYGGYIYATAITSYFVAFVNQGFDVSSLKRISENRDNTQFVSVIFSNVNYIKIVLYSFSFIIYSFFVLLILKPTNPTFYLFCFGTCISTVFFPFWLFQGLEEMKYITFVSFMIRAFSFVLIFIIITKENDYFFLPVINSVSNILGLLIIFFILLKKNIHFVKISLKEIKEIFKGSNPFFLSRIINTINEKTNAVIIGNYLGLNELAVYDLGSKIVTLIKTPFLMVAQVLYPNVSRTKDKVLIKKILFLAIIFSLLCVFVLVFGGKFIVLLLGGDTMINAYSVVILLSLSIPAVALTNILGASTLVVFGKSKEYNLSVIISFIFYIIFLFILYISNNIYLYTICIISIAPDWIVAICRIVYSRTILFIKER
jgi:PST family polysaccharide transporter